MPLASKRVCAAPNCQELVVSGRCAKHQRASYREDRDARGTAAQRGYNARHRRWRTQVLNRNPLCVDPYRIHRFPVASTIADHVIAVRDGGEWTLENGQGLCAACHNRKTVEETKQRG